MSKYDSACETRITPIQSQTNRIAGSGILFPRRSMASRMRCIASAPALRVLAEERRLGGDRLLELVEQHALVRAVDVRVAVGGPDEQRLGVRQRAGERAHDRDRAAAAG